MIKSYRSHATQTYSFTGRHFEHYSEVPTFAWRWKNFSPKEVACRGTGQLIVDEYSMDCLQALRDLLGKPIYLNSAFRSEYWNARVKGAKHSQHLKAKAYDCRMRNHEPYQFIAAAQKCGFTSFGHYPEQGFLHIDTREKPALWYAPRAFPKP